MTSSKGSRAARGIANLAVTAAAALAPAACDYDARLVAAAPVASSSQSTDASAGADAIVNDVDKDEVAVMESIRQQGLVTKRDACTLLTREDAEAAIGRLLPQNTTKNVGLGMCDYNTADFTAGASISVSGWDSVKSAAASGEHQPQVVAGIGDEALQQGDSNGSVLYVRKGDEGFVLTLNGPHVDTLADRGLAAEKLLAQKVLARF